MLTTKAKECRGLARFSPTFNHFFLWLGPKPHKTFYELVLITSGGNCEHKQTHPKTQRM